MKKELIYITPRLPWPLVTGDRIRCFNLLKELSKSFNITLIILEENSLKDTFELSKYSKKLISFKKKNIFRKAADIAYGIIKGYSLQESLYFRYEIKKILMPSKYDVLICHLLRSTRNVDFINAEKKILDMCDPVSLTYKQIINNGSKLSIWFYISLIEYLFTRRREKILINKFDKVFLHSEDDIQRANLKSSNILVSTMGISTDHLHKNFDRKDKLNNLIFIGGLDYYPNYNGLDWFLGNVFFNLSNNFNISIIGRGGDALKATYQDKRVVFHGSVESIDPYLRNAGIGIAPLFIASGIQNKILEYIYCGLGVISSKKTQSGLSSSYTKPIIFLDKQPIDWIKRIENYHYDSDIAANASEALKFNHEWSNIALDFKSKLGNY